ncbi:MAG: hypothetical protein AABZ55_06805, partial [Bdellovibrionota bacterium]
LTFLQGQPTSDLRTQFELQMDMIRALASELTTADLKFISETWKRGYDDGRFNDLLSGISLFVTRPVHVPGEEPGRPTLLDPILKLVKPAMVDQGAHLRSLLDYSGHLMRRDDFFKLLDIPDYLTRIEESAPEPVTQPDFTQYDTDRIKRWVYNKECAMNGTHPVEGTQQLRSYQMISDYRDAINSWDLVNGQPRRRWNNDEFRGGLEPVFKKIGDPAQSVPERPIPVALANFMRYFTLAPNQPPNEFQQFHIEDLYQWMRARSDDYRMITYYYPGESMRRARLVSTFDRMDLMLVNADFMAPFPFNKNFALEFLGEMGEAWGDEPRELWPREIRDKFPPGK